MARENIKNEIEELKREANALGKSLQESVFFVQIKKLLENLSAIYDKLTVIENEMRGIFVKRNPQFQPVEDEDQKIRNDIVSLKVQLNTIEVQFQNKEQQLKNEQMKKYKTLSDNQAYDQKDVGIVLKRDRLLAFARLAHNTDKLTTKIPVEKNSHAYILGCIEQAKWYLATDKPQKAKEILETVTPTANLQSQVSYYLAIALVKEGKIRDGLAQWEKSVSTDPVYKKALEEWETYFSLKALISAFDKILINFQDKHSSPVNKNGITKTGTESQRYTEYCQLSYFINELRNNPNMRGSVVRDLFRMISQFSNPSSFKDWNSELHMQCYEAFYRHMPWLNPMDGVKIISLYLDDPNRMPESAIKQQWHSTGSDITSMLWSWGNISSSSSKLEMEQELGKATRICEFEEGIVLALLCHDINKTTIFNEFWSKKILEEKLSVKAPVRKI
jgi:hypothetical protein